MLGRGTILSHFGASRTPLPTHHYLAKRKSRWALPHHNVKWEVEPLMGIATPRRVVGRGSHGRHSPRSTHQWAQDLFVCIAIPRGAKGQWKFCLALPHYTA